MRSHIACNQAGRVRFEVQHLALFGQRSYAFIGSKGISFEVEAFPSGIRCKR
jgi:hypothetical protein